MISNRLPVLKPSRVTLMIKPMGAVCNLACRYCYYLPTLDLYGGREKRMSVETLESVFAGFLPGADSQVTIAWQGGEPTLAGLDFFKAAVGFQKRYARPDQVIGNCLQTNGTRLDDDWCRFLREHHFLVGISIDGPADLHDHFRVHPGDAARGTHADVLRGLDLLRRHQVEHNVLTVLNRRNIEEPRGLFTWLVGLDQTWLQFIPAIEWDEHPAARCESDSPLTSRDREEAVSGDTSPTPSASCHDAPWETAPSRSRLVETGPRLADFSPTGEQYGRFLCEVFDLWFERYRDEVSVRIFDNVLSRMVHGEPAECTFAETCHSQITVEHNGDIYGCDHFVEADWRLGAIGPAAGQPGDTVRLTIGNEDADSVPDDAWFDRVNGERLGEFAARKLNLHEACRQCDYRPICNGGCPKHRPHRGDTADLNVLCPGYKRFFAHTLERFEWLASYYRRNVKPPSTRQTRKRDLAPAGIATQQASTAKPVPPRRHRAKRRR